MATTITIDDLNPLVLDETEGLQDSDVAISELPVAFSSRLFGALELNLDNTFPTLIGVGESVDDYITVSGDGDVVSLEFLDSSGGAVDGEPSGMFTLDGNQIFFYADSSDPNTILGREGTGATDADADANGDIVVALYLDASADLTSAKIWSVLFEPLDHPVTTDPDDSVMLDGLSIGAATELNFPFDNVASGNFYYVMLGSPEAAVLISSNDPDNVSTNTSQGGIGATVGLGSQMATTGDTMVLTFRERCGRKLPQQAQKRP